MLNQTLREVLFSPYYRVHPLEVLRLGYAKLVFSRHRLTDPRDFLAKSLRLDLTGALAGFERSKPKLEGVISSVWKEAGCQGGASLEDGIILYGITRAMRPKRVIETGVAAGVSTSFIGAALVENQQGTLFSIGLPRLYAQGGILAFPTLSDEWGVVVNEALASGIPVMGSLYSQAVEEMVRDGIDGWTFHLDRPEEIYAAIDRALTVPSEKLDGMRRTGRERIRPLTPEYGAKCILAAIDFACSSRGKKSPREGTPQTKPAR